MAKAKQEYGNESITSLKGADRVRKRPAVIFGSDGLEGCEHSVFEILSNSIDEAREGFGSSIIVTKYLDGSIQVEDFGRGIPVDYNQNEQRYNWELVFCELYAGGKYQNDTGDNYEFSLGLNGLGLCATQYSSEYMEVEIHRDKQKYTLRFEKGENVSFEKQPYRYKSTGSRIHWRPDLEVFTDIDIPLEYYQDVLRRQAIVNKGLVFTLKVETPEGFTSQDFLYQDGITDYVKEVLGDQGLTGVQYWETERTGRDREDKKDYRVKLSVAVAFSNRVKLLEYYHNSSWLEHGGSPDRAVHQAFVSQLDSYCKQNGKYNKNESKITFADV